MKNKLYLATAIANFIVCGAYIAMGQHVLAPFCQRLAEFCFICGVGRIE